MIPSNLLPTTHKPQSQNSKNMDGIKFLEYQSCFLAPFRGDFSDAKKMRKRNRDDERVGGVDGTLLKIACLENSFKVYKKYTWGEREI